MRTKYTTKKKNLIRSRKKQILDAAVTVFSIKGFAKARVDEIAVRAGLGKGTIYRYFGSKEDIFFAVVDKGMNTLKGLILDAISEEEKPLKKIEKAIRVYLLFFQKNKDFVGILTQERSEFRKRVRQRYLEHYYEHINKMEEVFRKGIAQKVLKKVDVRSAVSMLNDMVNGTIYRWVLEGGNYPLIDKLPAIVNIYFTGIVKER